MTEEPFLLSMWTVYDHPRDWPQWFVARRWEIRAGEVAPVRTDDMVFGRTLEIVRMHIDRITPGLFRLPRQPGDDPVVVETWV